MHRLVERLALFDFGVLVAAGDWAINGLAGGRGTGGRVRAAGRVPLRAGRCSRVLERGLLGIAAAAIPTAARDGHQSYTAALECARVANGDDAGREVRVAALVGRRRARLRALCLSGGALLRLAFLLHAQ